MIERSWIREELRTAGLFHDPVPRPPVPYDRTSERVILASVLTGHTNPLDLLARPRDFFVDVYGDALAVVESIAELAHERGDEVPDRPDLVLVSRVLERNACVSVEEVHAELLMVRDQTEFIFKLAPFVRRVRVLAKRRRAIAAMQRAEALMRADADPLDIADAVASLREVIS